MFRYFNLLILFLIFSFPAYCINLIELSKSDHWAKLLHYRYSEKGPKSDFDGETFFLSEDGAENPLGELSLLYQKINSSFDLGNQHVRCRFPARSAWLEKQLNLKLGPINCPALDSFRKKIPTGAVYMVFSSYYLSAPASVFGHTLFRFAKSADQQSELFNYGVNFSASDSPKDGAIMYALKGLWGGYQGQFSAIPYYYKIREYNDFESRDLWSYLIDLNLAERIQLIDHLWEVGNSYAAYFYLNKNCAYFLLSIIEAIRPSLNLIEDLGPFVFPIEVIKLLETSKLIKKVEFRPSQRTQFFSKFDRLNEVEKKVFFDVINKFNIQKLNSLFEDRKVLVLDTAISYFDYKYPKDILLEEKDIIHKKNKILLARSSFQNFPNAYKKNDNILKSPIRSHGTSRVFIGHGNQQKLGLFQQVGYEGAFHDEIDSQRGCEIPSTIELLKISFNFYNQTRSWQLNQLRLLKIAAVNPITQIDQKWSWLIDIGQLKMYDQISQGHLSAYLNLGAGVAIDILNEKIEILGLIESAVEHNSQFIHHNLRVGIGPSVMIRLNLMNNLRAVLKGNVKQYFFSRNEHPFHYESAVNWAILQNFSLRLKYVKESYSSSIMGQSIFYF